MKKLLAFLSVAAGLAVIALSGCKSLPGSTAAPPFLYVSNYVVGGVTNSEIFLEGNGPIQAATIFSDVTLAVQFGSAELIKAVPASKTELTIVQQALNDVMLQGNFSASAITNAIAGLGAKGVSAGTVQEVLGLINLWVLPTIDAKLGPSIWTAGFLKAFTAGLNSTLTASAIDICIWSGFADLSKRDPVKALDKWYAMNYLVALSMKAEASMAQGAAHLN